MNWFKSGPKPTPLSITLKSLLIAIALLAMLMLLLWVRDQGYSLLVASLEALAIKIGDVINVPLVTPIAFFISAFLLIASKNAKNTEYQKFYHFTNCASYVGSAACFALTLLEHQLYPRHGLSGMIYGLLWIMLWFAPMFIDYRERVDKGYAGGKA
jgi:hypothetical protein